jgi:hypothetical protein
MPSRYPEEQNDDAKPQPGGFQDVLESKTEKQKHTQDALNLSTKLKSTRQIIPQEVLNDAVLARAPHAVGWYHSRQAPVGPQARAR